MRKRILRILSIILIFCLCLSMLPAEAWAAGLENEIMPLAFFDGLKGDGTEEDPYQISTKEEFRALAEAVNSGQDQSGVYFLQTQDIDLGGEEDPWPVVGITIDNATHPFRGIFDGGNYNVNGLYVDRYDDDAGLFGYVGEGAVVRNVHVKDCDVSGTFWCGGIAGRNYGVIEYCSSTGEVYGSQQFAGGIVGDNHSGIVRYCYSYCYIECNQMGGGIAGRNSSGIIENCYFRGEVYSPNIVRSYVGGIVGENTAGSTVDNCYSTGYVEGAMATGAIAGANGAGSTVENCYYPEDLEPGVGGDYQGNVQGTVENVNPKSEDDFASGEVTWELSKGTNGDGWGQVLDRGEDDDPDGHPHFLAQPDKDDESEVYRVTFKSTNPKYDIKYYVDPGASVELPTIPENSKWYVDGEVFDGQDIQSDMDAVAGMRILFAGETDPIEVTGTYSTEAQKLEMNLDAHMEYADGGPSATGRFEYTITSDKDGLGALLNANGNALTIPAKTNVKKDGYTLTVKAHEKEPFIATLSFGPFNTKDVELTVKVMIDKADPVIVKKPTASTITYGEKLAASTLAEDGEAQHPKTAANVEGTFAWIDSSISPTAAQAAIVGYPVLFTPKDTNNYNTVNTLVTLTVNKLTLNYKAPEPIDSIYNGSAQNLIKPGSVDPGGTMMYSLDKDGEYSTDSPARANAGVYTIWYKVVGDENHNDMGPWSITATISPIELSIPEQEVIYNGSNTFTLALDGVTVGGEDTSRTVLATLTAASKNVGKYSYAAKGRDNCYTVELSNSNYIVDGNNAGTLTINPLPAVLSWKGPLTFIHDNREHTVEAYVNNAIDGDTFKLTYKREGSTTNTATDKGNYIAEITDLGNDNYTLKNAQNVEQPWYIYQESEHLTLTADKNPITYGEKLTLSFEITPADTSGVRLMALMQDQVEFSVNGKSLKILDVEYNNSNRNSATVTLTVNATSANNFSLGANAVTAVYSGNSNVSDGMDAITVNVIPKPITAKIIGNTTKTYDGHDTAIGLDVELDGVEDCDKDDVTVTVDNYTYNSANVTAATTIKANNVTLSGAKSGNYKITDSTTIGKIEPKVVRLEWSGYEGLVYNGNSVNVTAIATELIPGDTCEVAVADGNMINAGDYTATAVSTNSNYKLPADNTATQDYTIEPAPLYIPEQRVSYSGSREFDVELDGVTLVDGSSEKVAGKLISSSADVGSYDYAKAEADGKYTASESSNNYDIAGGATLTIEKADTTYTPPVAKDLTYNGSAQELLEAGSTEGGRIEYSLSEDGPWSTDIPTATEIGTYVVWYRIVGGSNYNDIAPQSIEVTIAQEDPNKTPKPDNTPKPSDTPKPGNTSEPGNTPAPSHTSEPDNTPDSSKPTHPRTSGSNTKKTGSKQGSHNVPKTGDETNITPWVMLMLLSLAGIVITLSPKKKIKSSRMAKRPMK